MLWIGHSGCFGFLVLVGGLAEVVVILLGLCGLWVGAAALNYSTAEVANWRGKDCS